MCSTITETPTVDCSCAFTFLLGFFLFIMKLLCTTFQSDTFLSGFICTLKAISAKRKLLRKCSNDCTVVLTAGLRRESDVPVCITINGCDLIL